MLRGCAFGPATDSPYAPLVRALRPALAALPDDELRRSSARPPTSWCGSCPSSATRLGGTANAGSVALTTVPERRQARLLEGILGVLGRLGERRPVLLVIEDLHRADAGTRTLVTFLARIARAQRLAIVGTYQADAIRRDDPWSVDLRSLDGAPRPPDRLTLGPLGRDDLARLIEAIEGERPSASVLVVVVERSGGRPLVAEELLAARRELPTVSLTVPFEDLVLARMAVRSPECRRVLRLLAPAGRPLSRATLAAVAEAFEIDADGGPPRSSSAPRRGDGVLDADLAAGLEEALDSRVRPRERGRGRPAPRAGRAGGRGRPPAVGARSAITRAGARRWPIGRSWRCITTRSPSIRRRPARRPSPRPTSPPRSTRRPTSWPRSSWRSRPRAPRRPAGDPARGVATAAKPTGRVRGRPISPIRAAEAAFAADRPVRAAAYLDATIGAADAPAGPDPARPHLRPARPVPAGRGRRRGRGRRATTGGRARPDERHRPPAPPSSPGWPSCACSRARSRWRRSWPATRSASRAPAGPSAAVWELHATTTLGVSLGWRADPDAAVAMLTDARRMAEALGDLDELFRVYANLTTVLDLAGRHEEAVAVAFEGIAAARSAGLEAVYGNFLRGNAADSLFLLGRWEEARSLSMTALEWLPAGVNFLNTLVSLATVEIELSARRGRRAAAGPDPARARGRPRRPAGRAAAPGVRVVRPVARRPRRRAARRRTWLDARARDRGLDPRRADGGDRRRGRGGVGGRGAGAARPGGAGRGARARPRRRASRPRPWCAATASTRPSGRGGSPMRGWRRRAPTAAGSTAATTRRRGATVGDAWAALKIPYETARARWREAEARLGSGAGRAGRADARAPLLEAVEIALRLGRDAAPARAARAGRPGAHHAAAGGRSARRPRCRTSGAASESVSDRRVAAGGPHRRGSELVRARDRRRRHPGGADQARHLRAQRPRARGAHADRPRPDEPGDRRAAVHQPEDRRRPRRQHPVQARRVRPRRGGGRGDPPGAHRAAFDAAGRRPRRT